MSRAPPATGFIWLVTCLATLAIGFVLAQITYAYWPTATSRGAARLDAEVRREYVLAGAYAGPAVRAAVVRSGRLLVPAAPQKHTSDFARELHVLHHALGARLALRLGVLAAILPLYLLLSVVALVDGCVARQVRRLAGRRESSFVYHRVKRLLLWLASALAALYLWPPWPVDPRPIFAVHAVLHAVLLRQSAATFKKYL